MQTAIEIRRSSILTGRWSIVLPLAAVLFALLWSAVAQGQAMQGQAIPSHRLEPGMTFDLVRDAAVFDGMPSGTDDAAFPPEIRTAVAMTAPSPVPWPDYGVRWLAVRLDNPAGSGTTADWILRMDCDPLFLPQVVVLKDGQVVEDRRRADARATGAETGAALAVGQRFGISVPAGESRMVLLRVMAISFGGLVADIVPRDDWVVWASHRQAIVTFALALIAAIALYTLLIGTSLRSSAYLLYVCHSVSLLVFWASYYGLPADLFGYTDHTRIVYKLSGTTATAIAPLMARAMLDVPRFAPILSRVLLGSGLLGLSLILPTIVLAPWPDLQRVWLRGPDWQYMLAPIVHGAILISAVRALPRSGLVAGFFLAGWTVYIAGTLNALGAFYNLHRFSGMVTLYAFLGAGWEALLLALALATRLRRLNREKTVAETQRRAQEDFLAMISHDLRTPLNAILGATGPIEDGDLPPPVRRRLETVRRASRVLLALISDLLDRASLSNNSLIVSRRAVALADCIREAADLVRDRAEERRLRLQLSIDPGLPPWIESDDLRLKQILFNLLDNAVQSAVQGEIVVTAAKGGDSGGERLLLSVRSDAKRRPRGNDGGENAFGLGLSIARDLARALGGDIKVEAESEEAGGLHLSLPLVAADPANPSPSGLLVLLVADAETDNTADMLRQSGHLVRQCEAADALRQVGLGGHDAVVLNARTSFTASDLARRIRDLPRDDLANLPVVAICDRDDAPSRALLAESGVFDVIAQPADAAAIQAALARAVDHGPCKVNFAMQSRAAASSNGGWAATFAKFRADSADLLHEIVGAEPQRRAELLNSLGRSATTVGLDALAAMAAELERRQRIGISVSGELAGLQSLWKTSLERSRN